MKVFLQHVAHARSGDKGDICNVAVIAYHEALFGVLREQLSAERLKTHYQGLIKGDVHRYEVGALWALNFVCHGALGGGVSRSLCLDNYGKSLSAAILSFELDVPAALQDYLVGNHSLR